MKKKKTGGGWYVRKKKTGGDWWREEGTGTKLFCSVPPSSPYQTHPYRTPKTPTVAGISLNPRPPLPLNQPIPRPNYLMIHSSTTTRQPMSNDRFISLSSLSINLVLPAILGLTFCTGGRYARSFIQALQDDHSSCCNQRRCSRK